MFVGSCHRMVKPIKLLHTKKSKKKKGQEPVTQAQEPVCIGQEPVTQTQEPVCIGQESVTQAQEPVGIG